MRKGNVFTSVCQEFCPQGGGVCLSVCWDTPPSQTRGCVSQHALRQTPPDQTPPRQTPSTATAEDGTHPTGMQSCIPAFFPYSSFFRNNTSESCVLCHVLGPVYTKQHSQHCDNCVMMLVILFSLKTMETLENGLQPHSGGTPLFSMRTVSLPSSHSCRTLTFTRILGTLGSFSFLQL